MKRNSIFLLGVLLIIASLLVGCDNASQSATAGSGEIAAVQKDQAVPAEGKEAKPQEISVKIYFPNNDGTKLLSVTQKVALGNKEDKYTAALQALLAGTDDAGMVTVIPKNTKLRSVVVKDGVAKVDFSQELTKKFTGGSTGEEMLAGSIVDTLTEFPEIKQVQFLVNGQEIETIGGHLDTSVPLARMDKLL